jgi:hypothetical protein
MSLRTMRERIRGLPLSAAHAVAQQAAPLLTSLARGSFDSGKNVYGQARPAGVDGEPLTLVASGDTRDSIRFVANGTIVRCVLGPRYAKYLVGKYGILPAGDRTELPATWSRAIGQIVTDAIRRASEAA